MFEVGVEYFEEVKTGKLSFDRETGTPSVSHLERGNVRFFDSGDVFETRGFKAIQGKDLQVNKTYFRLFKAPEPVFDSEGNLQKPRFVTTAFYEGTAELSELIRNPQMTSLLCDKLPDAVTALFGETDEEALVAAIRAAVSEA